MHNDIAVREDIPLAPYCSLELGGTARFFVSVNDSAELIEAFKWADRKRLRVVILGGGTNLVVADQGFDGLVIKMEMKGVTIKRQGSYTKLTASAGEAWDRLVEFSVREKLAGIECLSGIPGLAGSTVVQNVGAYGQEVSQSVVEVVVVDRRTRRERTLQPLECGFDYRASWFKKNPHSMAIVSVSFALRPDGAATLTYPELISEFRAKSGLPSLLHVREAIIDLRRSKSMLYEIGDENRRSVGSFFCNPILSRQEARKISRFAVERSLIRTEEEIPLYSYDQGRVKLSAAWLIEAAGFSKGYRDGNVGISSRHALALVHHGGGTTSELIDFANLIRRTVKRLFGILLRPEPTFLGFAHDPLVESEAE
ncbi:MAG: UDP-N-acetylmuramate dehydrogenase [Deltaproteobacteria bacterium]|nr:UDP-N-acetylmuramate dehydrogenase [Deltaproteobacteria bacterium]